jgi:signal transduction histidine kinase
MASKIAETLIGAQSDMQRIHRRVVQIGAVSAWAAAATFLIAGFLSNDESLFVEAVGPILAAGFMTTQIVLRKEHGGLALLGSAVVVMVMYGVVGNPDTLLPAALSLVIIFSIGILFVERHQIPMTVVLGLALAVAPAFWGVGFPSALQLGAVMVLSFVMTSLIFSSLRNAAAALNTNYKILFEQSPTAALEEDWSDSIAYIRSEYDGKPERIRQFLLACPSVVRRAVAMAKVVRVNRALLDLLEASGPGDLLGSRIPSMVNDNNLSSFVEVLASVYDGRELFEVEFESKTFTGRPIWLQARCVDSSRGANPDAIVVAMADISHIRANEEATEKLIRAKDQFIASISHELRTPLTAVVGLTAELSTSDLSTSERDDLMKIVSDQAEEMTFIVEDLLTVARADMGNVSIALSEVDLCAQVSTAVDGLGFAYGNTCPRTHAAYADPGRVRQILRNLLTNVERYGGSNARVVCGDADGGAWIEVRDDGEGVPAEDAERIFEIYTIVHPGVQASVGLGLAVSRQLAELMGGSLSYSRDLNESVFRLELPGSKAKVAV